MFTPRCLTALVRRSAAATCWAILTATTCCLPARAEVITDLFNTGVDSSGNVLSAGATDPHWTVVASPGQSGTAGPVNFYNGPAKAESINEWKPTNNLPANQATSRWITPPNAAGTVFFTPVGTPVNCNSGTFVYQTTFTLPTGFTSATITGRFACDNTSPGLLLNGFGATVGSVDADKFLTFSFTEGFQSGSNTLQFYVFNDPDTAVPNPTGLQVQLTGVYAVPEPSALALAVVGAGLAGFAIRRGRSRRR